MNKLTKQFWLFLLGISIICVIILTVAIVFFTNRKPDVIEKEKKGAVVYLNYSSNFNGLSISKAVPTIDEIGIKNEKKGEYFDFSVEVNLDNASSVEYELSIIKDKKNSTINDNDIRIYLEKEKSGTYTKVFGPIGFSPLKEKSALGSPKGSMVLMTSKKINSSPDNYRLRIWLSDKAVIQDGKYSVEVAVNGVAK